MNMESSCLILREDKTVAYIHPMHQYNPKGTPRPNLVIKPVQNKTASNKLSDSELSEQDLYEILRLYF